MHWTAAQPGCLDIERELVLIEQTPGEIVFLSAADTDLSCVASVWRERFGKRLRIAHAFSLRQPVAADHYIETVLRRSKLVVARLLGGRAYFAHFIQGVLELKEEPVRPKFLIFSGTGSDGDELALLSDFPTEVCRRMFEFFQHGGRENIRRAAEGIEQLLADRDELLEPVTVKLLSSLSAAGYRVEPCPQDGEELMRWLQSGVTNDRERSYGRPRYQEMDREEFEIFLGSLSPKRREELSRNWPAASSDNQPVAGIRLGDIFVGIQPPRGYSLRAPKSRGSGVGDHRAYVGVEQLAG